MTVDVTLNLIQSLSMLVMIVTSSCLQKPPHPLWESGFAYGRSVTSPDNEQMEQTVAMPLLWNSVSVEQIQDRDRVRGKKVAFTLAEVLITLGIIGVVAALTLPALISHYKKVETSSRIKKFYSVMSQAVIMSKEDNGDIEDWGISAGGTFTSALDEFFSRYFAPYIKYSDTKYVKDSSSNQLIVYLNDGSYFYLTKGNCVDISYDVNGDKAPNEFGRDKFKFLLCGENTYGWCDGKHWCSYYYNNNTRAQRLERCKQDGMFCSGLLEYDNWEFNKDYPHRL